MASLTTAIAAMQALAGDIVGVKGAPTYPPESINQFPFAVTYPGFGEWELMGAAWSQDFHELITEIHLSRVNLPTAVSAALPYYERFRNALAADPTLGGAVLTIHGQDQPIRYEFGFLDWTSNKGRPEKHIGWRFKIRVKIHSTLS